MKQKKEFSIGYFSGMDVLRFICAAGVIFHHATLTLKEKGTPTFAEKIHSMSGPFFLDVFFIISGFLISLILMKEHESGTFSVKNFYIRRIIRIWPLYFLAVFLRIFLFPALNGAPQDLIKTNLLYACTFTVNYQLIFTQVAKTYAILWSICIEEHIYLILPFLVLLFNKKFKAISLFLIIAGLLSWFYFSSIPSINTFSIPYFVSTSYFYYFGIGVLIACIKNGNLPGKNLESTVFKPWMQAVAVIIISGYIFNIWGSHRSLLTILFMHGFFGGYLVWASAQENFIFDLKPSLARYLGNISYAMYVSHITVIIFVINFFKKKNPDAGEAFWGWGVPLIACFLCIGLSTLLYTYFERPILKFKEKFTTVLNKG